MNNNSLDLLFFGSAGAAKAVYYWLKAANKVPGATQMHVLGFVEKDEESIGQPAFAGEKIIACDDNVEEIIRKYDRIGAIVPFADARLKRAVVARLKKYPNVVFPNVIHPAVIFDEEGGGFGEGNYIGPGVVFESEYNIGNFNYIGNGVQFGHDLDCGDYNAILPACAVAGHVTIGSDCMLGLNSSVIQELTIADKVIVGAGAVVTRSLEESGTYVGMPAKKIK